MSKRYRLLKDLPDAKMGTILEFDGNKCYDYKSNKTIDTNDQSVSWYRKEFVENRPEWFEEVKEEWEIVNYIKNEFIHPSVRGNCVREGCKIHSVRRTSDGEVFSVGDELCELGLYSNEKHKIKSIRLINGTIGLEYGDGGEIIIKAAKKYQPEIKENKEEVPFTWEWTDELVKEFCEYAGYRISGREDIRSQVELFLKVFKQSKAPIKEEKMKVGIMENLHRNACDDFYQIKICTSNQIPEKKFPLIKEAIESILNNEKGKLVHSSEIK